MAAGGLIAAEAGAVLRAEGHVPAVADVTICAGAGIVDGLTDLVIGAHR